MAVEFNIRDRMIGKGGDWRYCSDPQADHLDGNMSCIILGDVGEWLRAHGVRPIFDIRYGTGAEPCFRLVINDHSVAMRFKLTWL